MRELCDKCKGQIIKQKCHCGYWYEKDEAPNFSKTIERALMAYDHMCEQYNNNDPFSGDHHTGNCIVLFKGTYEDTQKVRAFIKKLKK